VDEKSNEDTIIEITPEMMSAGMHEYSIRWPDLCDADDDAAREMLIAAYRAMYLASTHALRSCVDR
jgi:hypothetical protein